MKKCYSIKVFGKVQGVGYRYFMLDMANKLGVKGFVRNHENGIVYIEAEGEDVQLNQFIKFCKKGPSFSDVQDIQIEESPLMHYDKFVIQ